MHNEKLLLREIAEGDLPAFRRFFDLYRDRLFIFVEQLTHSRADAEEIIQDTFPGILKDGEDAEVTHQQWWCDVYLNLYFDDWLWAQMI